MEYKKPTKHKDEIRIVGMIGSAIYIKRDDAIKLAADL